MQTPGDSEKKSKTVPKVKIVAEMPDDDEIRENLPERQANDGYPGSCGVSSASTEVPNAE